MEDPNFDQNFAKQLSHAFLAGPPEEVCMVLDGDKLRHLNEDELKEIGSYFIESLAPGVTEIDLYGQAVQGWKLVFESA